MPSYREINDTEVAVDAPLTQQLLQALKDNLLAIIEDDASAPSIKRSSISDAVADQKVASAGNVSIGAEQVLRATGSEDITSNGFVIAVAGVYNLKGLIKKDNTFGTVRCDILKNGVSIENGTNVGSTSAVTMSAEIDDVTLQAGDVITVKMNEISNIGLNDATAVGLIGTSVETAAFYNRIGGRDISSTSSL